MKFEGKKLPVVCLFGVDDVHLKTARFADYEEEDLDCRCYHSDDNLEQILINDRPHVIITIGNGGFKNLSSSPYEIRKRWLHYDTLPDLGQLGGFAYHCYTTNLFDQHRGSDINPLVTVFTSTYKTGWKIQRPFKSLIEQTYGNWEWVIIDDSDDSGETFKMLQDLAKKDHRISVYKPWEHSGIIGKNKNHACMLGRGEILVEMDHDDEFTDYALQAIVDGFKQYPDAGFLYTDCAEIYDSGESTMYGEGWAFGYGKYEDALYKNVNYKSAIAANINPKTIRHIVSVPNHARCWRKSFYESIDGHNRELHVCDDYEIIVRTFLKTRMVHVPKMCYLQYVAQTTQRVRNKDIQRHVRTIRNQYDRAIHDRFVELGCDDYLWDASAGWSNWDRPNPPVEPHVTLTAKI